MTMLVNNKSVEVHYEALMWDDAGCAFVKFVPAQKKWVIFTADGEKVTEADNRDQAFVIAKQWCEFVVHSAH